MTATKTFPEERTVAASRQSLLLGQCVFQLTPTSIFGTCGLDESPPVGSSCLIRIKADVRTDQGRCLSLGPRHHTDFSYQTSNTTHQPPLEITVLASVSVLVRIGIE